MTTKYAGYLSAPSGMGEAARNYIASLSEAGVHLVSEFVPNLSLSKDLGKAYRICRETQDSPITYDTKIIHTTPDVVRQHMEPMKYHIFHLFWETDRLPKWWVWELNHSVDEIWTGSLWNKRVFEKSGIKLPIYVFPQAIPTEITQAAPFKIKNHQGFLFGAVFQWIQRKNPKALLHAYWKEFEHTDGVGLLIKTYKERFSSEEAQQIMDEIRSWKKDLHLSRYAPVYFCKNPLSKQDMNRLYSTIDCFVSSHCGEGWGIPIAEAMLAGKPVISTNLGGIHEYLPEKLWFPCSYEMGPVHDMDWVKWYEKDQRWGEIDEACLMRQMRSAFDFPERAKEKGKMAQEFVQSTFNYATVGKAMKERLEKI